MDSCLFSQFDSEDAFRLGQFMYQRCQEQGIRLGIEIYLYGRTVFQYLPNGLGADKADWLRRKRNSVLYFGMSTMNLYEKCNQNEQVLATKYAKDLADYTITPGSVPIWLNDSALVGAVTVTGLAPELDHHFVSTAFENYAKEVNRL